MNYDDYSTCFLRLFLSPFDIDQSHDPNRCLMPKSSPICLHSPCLYPLYHEINLLS